MAAENRRQMRLTSVEILTLGVSFSAFSDLFGLRRFNLGLVLNGRRRRLRRLRRALPSWSRLRAALPLPFRLRLLPEPLHCRQRQVRCRNEHGLKRHRS